MVVKYLFQFGFFPWNGHVILLRYEGKPFFPPRILGLERSTQYIKYDLLQLLALFFHRSLLLVSPGPWVGLWGELELLLGAPGRTQWVLGGSSVVSHQCWWEWMLQDGE